MSIPLIVILSTLAPTESPAPAPAAIELEATSSSSWEALDAYFHAPTEASEAPTAPEPTAPSPPVFVDEDSWYARLTGGLVTSENADGPEEEVDFDEAFFLALGVGYHFGAEAETVGFDIELEGTWTDQDTSGDISAVRDVNTASLFLNGLLDVRIYEQLFIYGGGGVGASFVDVGTQSDELNDFDAEDGPFLAWQVKAGLLYRFNERLSANVGYRFVNINDVEITDEVGTSNFDLSTEQHVLELGLGFAF